MFANPSALSLELAAGIARESARFNIGPSRRTINNPALVLFVLDPAQHYRFRFTKDDEERMGSVRTWVVQFTEAVRPTIVRMTNGHDEQCAVSGNR